ncbi:transcription intermediary factor 1-beta-like [Littorina saxatilis]|uniref:transcription intermediary factor 1-beta-like n=1 Tax=Littorina saxatilis TaxID=31220 RepID=UPI0038B63583
MAGVTSGDIECPVCHDDFTNPKLLPCNHLACRDCVLSWLQKEGGCPLCRAPILSSTQQGQGQLATMVDWLPTDFATAALVESHKVLNGPHVCDVCQNNVTATSYCFDCSIKLCKACTSHHQKLPVSKTHTLEQLNKLTAKQLAANRQATCNNHSNTPAKLYCSAHQELICMFCDATNHRSCPEVKAITDVAREKRTELTQQSQRLKEKAAGLAKQMKAAKEKFKGMHKKVNDVFDDLQQCSEKRRQQVHDLIQKEEDATMTSLAEMEKARAAMTSNSSNIDHLVTSAPDDALLQMLNQLKSRLDDLESESGKTAMVKDVGDIVFDSQLQTRLKSDLSELGEIQKPHQQASASPSATATTTAPSSGQTARAKPRRADLAAVLKVGDRVRRGPDWGKDWFGFGPRYNVDGGGPGTVTSVSSWRGRGGVDVRWDCGGEGCYRMGVEGCYRMGAEGCQYDLDLA